VSKAESIVFVVDDDPSVRRAMKRLIGCVGLQVELFASAQEFFASEVPNLPSCLVLDIRLPGIRGLNLQHQLAKSNIQGPIIFITAHGDIRMRYVLRFLTGPVDDCCFQIVCLSFCALGVISNGVR
jgi:FixJ family two-component response regulator